MPLAHRVVLVGAEAATGAAAHATGGVGGYEDSKVFSIGSTSCTGAPSALWLAVGQSGLDGVEGVQCDLQIREAISLLQLLGPPLASRLTASSV